MNTQINYAGMIRRIIAYVVDQGIYYLIFGLLLFLIFNKPLYPELYDVDINDTTSYTDLFSLLGIAIVSLIVIVSEILMLAKFGQTPGKFICSARVKHENTSENITFRQVVIRSVLKEFLFVPGYFYGWFFILPILALRRCLEII
ncbi:RDD family protein [Wolbachia endosymbiont of Pentalonia nigronervosa]|jgi:uncharacterized RDD family membrane protein YckC|uniref:RDD family protein n=1 Tax=Wolbachia endosymbiont of Pentalonia nigronervosa TaxID=1301914 RepID=UPI00165FBE11|nr:RDD family protein [Wolbachia endosymbiont of Pentalonia nigronervosa]MBD0392121.1 RDD family protein [Wolbachia endosymbiont of Pentalonia nigronervosa]